MNWRQVIVMAVVIAVASTGYAVADNPTRTVTITKVVKDKKARSDLKKLSRKFDRLQRGFNAAPDRKLSTEDEARFGAMEHNARDAKAAVKGLNVGTFPNGATVSVSSERDDGTYGTTDPPQPVNLGSTEFRFVDCPDGTTYVSGGYATVGNSGFAYNLVFFQLHTGNGYSVGIDNHGNTHSVRVIVQANCIPGMVSNPSNDHALEKQLVQDQIASH